MPLPSSSRDAGHRISLAELRGFAVTRDGDLCILACNRACSRRSMAKADVLLDAVSVIVNRAPQVGHARQSRARRRDVFGDVCGLPSAALDF
jgi:hypothetical protein